MAVPGEFLLGILHRLCEDPRNDIVLMSGRSRDFLDRFFSTCRIGLVAEQGAWIKQPGLEWKALIPRADEWKPKLRPLLEKYVDRIAGTLVEEKDYGLVWHYRAADAEPGKIAARELKDHLRALTANLDVHILQGNKTVEIRMAGVNKRTGAFPFVTGAAHDFMLCIGDDENDKDLFGILPENAYSIHVGLGGTAAQHTLPDVRGVVLLLNEMAHQCAQETLFPKIAVEDPDQLEPAADLFELRIPVVNN
jgi:trehalose 6-phosphate synthase/phosphatase